MNVLGQLVRQMVDAATLNAFVARSAVIRARTF